MRLLGIVLIICSCSCVGFMIAASYKKELNQLKRLISVLNLMECELAYHLTPLPELCHYASDASKGWLRDFFIALKLELENQVAPQVDVCVSNVLHHRKEIPHKLKKMLYLLGESLGKFDLEGQIKGISAVTDACKQQLESLQTNQAERIRSYRTLGVCAGIAIAIILI